MARALHDLIKIGQSVWHDNIRRELLTSGKLRRMVDDGWITGLTSNPTIFEQAIAKSTDYDADIERLARDGKNAEEIFDALAIDDIRNAAEVFRPVYDRTAGDDGYVSIEVAPKWANDTNATIPEARRLWDTVGRSNLMVKIPATREGVPAIEESIRAGLNINVTLIFSLERYDEVMTAYLNGLIRRHEAGESVADTASVASFFVSRVDTLVDRLLDEKIQRASSNERPRLEALKGKAAIANAKLAYESFRKKFAVESFAFLQQHGARVQRPLWASTSTKNPAYPDTYYVEALVGPDSVDTMPPQTLEAYADHGQPEPRIEEDVDGARRVMDELRDVGIDMREVTRKLEVDGVASFAASYDSLIEVVEKRRQAVLAKPASRAARKPPRRAARSAAGTRGKKKAKKARPGRKPARGGVKTKARARKAAAPRRRSGRTAAKRTTGGRGKKKK